MEEPVFKRTTRDSATLSTGTVRQAIEDLESNEDGNRDINVRQVFMNGILMVPDHDYVVTAGHIFFQETQETGSRCVVHYDEDEVAETEITNEFQRHSLPLPLAVRSVLNDYAIDLRNAVAEQEDRDQGLARPRVERRVLLRTRDGFTRIETVPQGVDVVHVPMLGDLEANQPTTDRTFVFSRHDETSLIDLFEEQ